jgi:hypothetical protein
MNRRTFVFDLTPVLVTDLTENEWAPGFTWPTTFGVRQGFQGAEPRRQ